MEVEAANVKIVMEEKAPNVKIAVEDKQLCLDIAKEIAEDITQERINNRAEVPALQSYSHTEYCARAPGGVVPVILGVASQWTFLFYRLVWHYSTGC